MLVEFEKLIVVSAAFFAIVTGASAHPKNDFVPTDKTALDGIATSRSINSKISNYSFSPGDYSFDLFARHVRDIPLDIAGVYGGALALGFANWNWGNQGFRFNAEGGFGKNTGSGGVDKVGHAFIGALISDYFIDRIRQSSTTPQGAAETGALLSFGVMSVVEVFDGFSGDHGFSYEDMIANSLGIGFSYLKNTIPGLREKIDFRQEYLPTRYSNGFRPFLGYEDKKFLLAVKLSGFEALQDTPMRYVELHAGYYARGFNAKARRAGARKRRTPYFAIGINLSELLLKKRQRDENPAKTWTRFGLEHFQVPYTYVGTNYLK